MDNIQTLPTPLLEMRGIVKRFAGVVALDGVDLQVRRGECHALVGENGAGKSTLIKVLSGAYAADAGNLSIDGAVVANPTPRHMRDLGVAVIYQELSLAPHLTVAENVFLGRMPRRSGGIVNWQAARSGTRQILARLGVAIDPDATVGELSIAQQQMVEIAKAMSVDARMLVLDEPSAVLGDAEIDVLFDIIRTLQGQGIAFIYISHRLKEVFQIGDRVSVLRDGRTVAEDAVDNMNPDVLVRHMVGRELRAIYPARDRVPGDVLLSAKGLRRGGAVRDVSLEVRAGEIVAIAGLAGAGRTELLRVLAGADRPDAGELVVAGDTARFAAPRQAVARGVGLVPEDRKVQGLFLQHSVRFNVSSASLPRFARQGILQIRREKAEVESISSDLRIKAPNIEFVVGGLSGGNQQKVVIGRWLTAGCRVLLADEPTRGVDVGAKQEIYRLLDRLARAGMAVLFVSSELPEVIGLADRILVMREGRISAALVGGTATEEQIMRHATDPTGAAIAR